MNLSAWILAARPATLTAAWVPVIVGTAVAYGEDKFRFLAALMALLGASAIQVGTNFANDVFDYEKGADTEERLGPTRAVQAGLLSPQQMKRGMWLSFALAFLSGIYLMYTAGWIMLAVGVVSIAAGIAYTAGPYPLAYVGLGDVFVMIFFGFVAVMGTTYVQSLELSSTAAWAAVPVGALSTAILVVNNLRDHVQDAKANKRTLVVRFGTQAARLQYLLMHLLAQIVPAYLAYRAENYLLLLPLLTLPVSIRLISRIYRLDGAALNPYLGNTAKLLLVHGLLLSIGLAWSV